ncbi:PREDICTED: uncharacterized protein LOC104746651 [Camelina sativa]|uniref:Uncharacterized protein LOC104746651 n=1 Tax=Camelina sativa TaxID=90675 RepID=A0ABM1QZS2_CAMSA|nr:PREDICTED: uncharacterized protein LOC104746651 [Camelina sativa]
MGTAVLDAKTSSLREHPPSSYSIKFENLTELDDDKYESSLFAVGGYNWRLVIYPKGNAKDEGSGFISMYVEIDSANLLSTPLTDVFAYLIFFVYNKKADKYFTIKDTELKRFNALRTVWGMSQGEQCEFGVDVLVAPSLAKWEVVSFNPKIRNPKFSWTLKKFKELKEDSYNSDNFMVGGRQWFLKLHPNGDARAKGKSVSIYLTLRDDKTLNAEEKIYTRAHLTIVDSRGTTHVSGTLNYWYTKLNSGFGWSTFASLDKLREAYLDNEGSLNVEIEFIVVSSTKYSPSI